MRRTGAHSFGSLLFWSTHFIHILRHEVHMCALYEKHPSLSPIWGETCASLVFLCPQSLGEAGKRSVRARPSSQPPPVYSTGHAWALTSSSPSSQERMRREQKRCFLNNFILQLLGRRSEMSLSWGINGRISPTFAWGQTQHSSAAWSLCSSYTRSCLA